MLLIPQMTWQTPTKTIAQTQAPLPFINLIKPLPEQPKFPSPTPEQVKASEDKVAAERAAEAAAAQAAQEAAAEAARQAQMVEMQEGTTYVLSGTLTGSEGYSLAGGNCVLEPGVNNPGWGNPIDWPVLSSEPTIGATVLFVWNHTAVVTGLWSNGDVEVRQQNAGGAPHRIPRNEIRGYR